jgi:predicted nucleotidyltransferase
MSTEAINPEELAVIQQKLDAISSEHSVRILMAVESGSRAWGFASTDSDYDVRFIYCRSPEAYLDIHLDSRSLPDHIEDTKDAPFDIVGWDIRKAMSLLLKANITPLEWSASKIKYIENSDLENEFSRIAQFINPYSLFRHHLALADQASKVMLSANILNADADVIRKANFINPKKMLYALRSYLSCEWILDDRKPMLIPVDIHELARTQSVDFKVALNSLIANKGDRVESEYCIADPMLLEYCSTTKRNYSGLTENYVREKVALKTDSCEQIATQDLFDSVNTYLRKVINEPLRTRNVLRIS